MTDFDKVWGNNQITVDTIAESIAAFERTLITPNSRYDAVVEGEKVALNAQEKRGLDLVQKYGCMACHSGSNFSDPGLNTDTADIVAFLGQPDRRISRNDSAGSTSDSWSQHCCGISVSSPSSPNDHRVYVTDGWRRPFLEPRSTSGVEN